MKNYFWTTLSIFTALGIITTGTTLAQTENASQNNSGFGTAVANLTNATSSYEDAKNMSVIEGTMNGTTPETGILNQTIP